ncbi:SH2 domain-containing protein 1B [Aplochiton taeniatus]
MATGSFPSYYHGAISKQTCEELLGKKGKDGAYLIRDSETIQGALCLCVYKNAIVYTYRLLQTHTGYYTLQVASGVEEKFFKSLDDLIRHFKRRNQGLAMHLRHLVKRKTVLSLPPPQVNDEEADYENLSDSPDYVAVLPF